MLKTGMSSFTNLGNNKVPYFMNLIFTSQTYDCEGV